MRPAVALAAAWVAQLARDQRIDAALLATRGDLVAFLRSNGQSRLGQGWRAGMVGEPVARLLRGEAALAFDGGGRLVLEARSRQPLPAPAAGAERPGRALDELAPTAERAARARAGRRAARRASAGGGTGPA